MRHGDLDIYPMDANGKNIRRLTHELGYDGGPFFSPDGKKIVFRAYHPETPEEIADYKSLLAQNLLRPTKLDIWVMDANGSNKRRVTSNGAANFAPSGILTAAASSSPPTWPTRKAATSISTSSMKTAPAWSASLVARVRRVPMFTRDAKKLVWASNAPAASAARPTSSPPTGRVEPTVSGLRFLDTLSCLHLSFPLRPWIS
jgi:hypothetical protein